MRKSRRNARAQETIGYRWGGIHIGVVATPGGGFASCAGGTEQAVLVLGPPRSGKTSAIVIPTILRAPAAVVSTSTKPDVLGATLRLRSRLGVCFVFDPTNSTPLPPGADELRWSPVTGCERFEASVAMAHALSSAARPGAPGTEAAHWVERAEALLAPLLHAAAVGGRDMGAVCGWVLGHDVREAEAILAAGGAPMARVVLSSVWRAEERERSGIFSTCSGLLSAYRSEAVLDAACRPNFDPAHFAASTDTLYICAPGHAQDQLAPLVVALLEQIRAAVYARRARHPDAAPVIFALDEVANIAPLRSLPEIAAEGGGQGLVTLACLQDLSQARARWGQVADGFFSLFSVKIVLPGIADARTLELISALGGDVPLTTRSVTSTRTPFVAGALGMMAGRPMPMRAPSVTTSTVWRRRLPVDAVAVGRPGEALVLSSAPGVPPITTVGIVPWWSIPLYRSLVLGPEA